MASLNVLIERLRTVKSKSLTRAVLGPAARRHVTCNLKRDVEGLRPVISPEHALQAQQGPAINEKTNIGKKNTRQVDRLLTKAVQEGRDRIGGKQVEARLSPQEQQNKMPRTKRKASR